MGICVLAKRELGMTETVRLIILGSTGSIGTQALDVVAHINSLADAGKLAVRFEVVGIAAGKNASLLCEQARKFGVRAVACAHGALSTDDLPTHARAFTGPNAAEELVRSVDCDTVLCAMVGFAGLPATLAAVERGRTIALANKETLVAAGSIVMDAAARSGARILPTDSEHAALWQCIEGPLALLDRETGDRSRRAVCPAQLRQLGASAIGLKSAILTASGGPFRLRGKDAIESATAKDALAHPTWSMGAKVTIDSASLTNKALELIEAHWLFGLPADKLRVLVHPQSVVHAIAEYEDGSSTAQLAMPDMRVPIQRSLLWPRVAPGSTAAIRWGELRSLEFFEPDTDRFPALLFGWRVIEEGGTSGATLNAANEEAVNAFLHESNRDRFPFGLLYQCVAEAMSALPSRPIGSYKDVLSADAAARTFVRDRLRGMGYYVSHEPLKVSGV